MVMLLSLFGILLILPPVIYLGVSWIFASLLIVDKGLDFWPAMELSRKVAGKQFFSVFGLLFLCGLIMIAGVLALCLGLFVAAPIVFATIADRLRRPVRPAHDLALRRRGRPARPGRRRRARSPRRGRRGHAATRWSGAPACRLAAAARRARRPGPVRRPLRAGRDRRPGPTPAPQPTIDPEAAFARIVAEGPAVRVFDSLRRGWDLVFARPGPSRSASAPSSSSR